MIIWRPSALRDTARIFGYIAEHDIEAARKMVAIIYAAPRRLVDFPRSGPERADIADGLRSVKAGRFIVLYRIDGEDIDVVRVLHSAQNLAASFAAGL